jgi:hypothetical protein
LTDGNKPDYKNQHRREGDEDNDHKRSIIGPVIN